MVTEMPLADLVQRVTVRDPGRTRKLLKCLSMPLSIEIMNQLYNGRVKRYNEIKKMLGIRDTKGFSRALLSLTSLGLVQRTVMPFTPPAVVYEITDFGKSVLENIAMASDQFQMMK